MRFKGHESFYLRQGWITKGLINVDKRSNLFYLDKKEQTDLLGIGSNMVKALKYWLDVFGLMSADSKHKTHEFTDFGKVVWDYDRYIQEADTLWLLHYKLSTDKDKATSWYWLFNEFDVSEFSEEEFIRNLCFYAKKDGKGTQASIKGDIKCIVKTYISAPDEDESNLYSPLSELRLLKQHEKKKLTYTINERPLPVSPEVVFYVILNQYINSDYQNKSREINIERLNSDINNIGKIFRLNWNTINEYLDILNKKELIGVVRTAGLDVIRIKYGKTADEFLSEFYENSIGR